MKSGNGPGQEIIHAERTPQDVRPSKTIEDIAVNIVDAYEGRQVTAEENKRVLRRVDLVILPLMFISYGLQFMDKGLLGNAAQFGIIEDLHLYQMKDVNGEPIMVLKRFSNATLVFYWGFVAGCKYSLSF